MLIFDEVHVVARLMWNSHNQKLVGFVMTPGEMSCLLDVYQTLEDHATKGTNHMLQFTWRDMTSNFDIIGPYYTSNGPFESKFLIGTCQLSKHQWECQVYLLATLQVVMLMPSVLCLLTLSIHLEIFIG